MHHKNLLVFASMLHLRLGLSSPATDKWDNLCLFFKSDWSFKLSGLSEPVSYSSADTTSLSHSLVTSRAMFSIQGVFNLP